jgi:hypothetical protein
MIASTLQLAARILGYGSYRNLSDTLYDRPDRTEELPDGRIRRKWFLRTVWAVADARTGRQSHRPHPGNHRPTQTAPLRRRPPPPGRHRAAGRGTGGWPGPARPRGRAGPQPRHRQASGPVAASEKVRDTLKHARTGGAP